MAIQNDKLLNLAGGKVLYDDLRGRIESIDTTGQIAPVEGTTATTAHAVGEVIALEGQLYVVTSYIRSGDTIAVGTNIASTKVSEELAKKVGQTSIANVMEVDSSGYATTDFHVGDIAFFQGKLYRVGTEFGPNGSRVISAAGKINGNLVEIQLPDVLVRKSNPTAVGLLSINRNYYTKAADNSVAVGSNCQASGSISTATGNGTSATGGMSFAEGYHTTAGGEMSHAHGDSTTSFSDCGIVFGKYNVPGSPDNIPEWTAEYASGKSQWYYEGNVVKHNNTYYECIESNQDATFTPAHWHEISVLEGDYLEIVGNGSSNYDRTSIIHSNARTLDWDGNETLSGRLVSKYIRPVATGTGTAGQAGSSTVAYTPSLWTFDLGLTPTEGDTLLVKVPVAGVNAGIWMSVDNGTTYYPVAITNTAALTTTYPVGAIVMLTYEVGRNTTIYGTSISGAAPGATAAAYTSDRWVVTNYYANTTYSIISESEMNTGTATTGRLISAARLALKANKASPVFTGSISLGRSGTEGSGSIAVGSSVTASGDYSQASGGSTYAYGRYSHAEGNGTIATGQATHVFGKNNEDLNTGTSPTAYGTYAEMVGNGDSYSNRSNARTLDWEGNERLNGDLYVQCESDSSGGYRVIPNYRTETTGGIALNPNCEATGNWALASGNGVKATGNYSTAIGYNTVVTGDNSFASGYSNNVRYQNSNAIGMGLVTYVFVPTITGMYNLPCSSTNIPSWATGTDYKPGMFVKYNGNYYECKYAHKSGSTFSTGSWYTAAIDERAGVNDPVEIVGIGRGEGTRANGRILDNQGNEIITGEFSCTGKIKIGNTSLTEADLQALLALLH